MRHLTKIQKQRINVDVASDIGAFYSTKIPLDSRLTLRTGKNDADCLCDSEEFAVVLDFVGINFTVSVNFVF